MDSGKETTTIEPTCIDLFRGRLRVRGWPPGVRPPFGLCPAGAAWHGLPRLRWRVRQALDDARVRYVDEIAPPSLPDARLPAPPPREPAILQTWLEHGGRGIAVGLDEADRHGLLVAAVREQRAAGLVVVRDTAAASVWRAALGRRGPDGGVEVVTIHDAARTMHWRAGRHELLAVDRPGQMPTSIRTAALDASAARLCLGFVDDARHASLIDWSCVLGPVLAIAGPTPGARRLELRVRMSAPERAEHDRAWDVFLCAYDRFVALRPDAGFGAFVAQARCDPLQRDAVVAWHRATRIAGWNVGKAAAVAGLLARHRDERTLVFTPDRASAYALARAHLIAAVTAELRRRERDAILGDFRAGRLRALAGPRLLDLGVPEGSAQVGILVGGSFGRAQRASRCRRVAADGIVYELVTQDTTEVGRGQRALRSDAGPPGVDHEIG